jgi:hypothetical protein
LPDPGSINEQGTWIMAAFDIIEGAVRMLPSGNRRLMTTTDLIVDVIRGLAGR